jgi:hypothetical protein
LMRFGKKERSNQRCNARSTASQASHSEGSAATSMGVE